MANAWDRFTNAIGVQQAAEQEEIVSNTPVPNPLEGRASGGSGSGRVTSALVMTIVIAAFFFGLAWAVGNMTGVSLFNKVEQAVS